MRRTPTIAAALPQVPGYRLLRPLGEGGMGQVFVATAEGSSVEVAVKLLHPELAAKPQLAAQFTRVAEALRAVSCPEVVRVLEVGCLSSGVPFLVMEHLDGETLSELLSREAPLDAERVNAFAHQAARGLVAAHAAGLVHLDLTPNNLFISSGPDEMLRLIDFGIAQLDGVATAPPPSPEAGSSAYWSPEQAGGRALDARSDLYSLGLVLHQALCGALPLRAAPVPGVVDSQRTPATPGSLRRRDGVPVPDVLAHVVLRCLAAEPERRYPSAKHLLEALPAQLPSHARPLTGPTLAATPRTLGYAPKLAHADTVTPQTPVPGDPATAPHDNRARTLIGSYRLLEQIGEGGMGVVYLAEHARLGRRVAIKLLRPELSNDAQSVSRFFAEARAVNRISHENIVEITDFIENPGGDNYYIMEFLPGLNLDQLVQYEGPLDLARTLGIAVQVCSALASVHEADIVHRDLKPENIFLTERGGQKDFVKLLDFGIAKLGNKDDAVALHRTSAGTIIGTPEYMSPEQASGVTVDHRSDIYSIGIILYELVASQNPFQGANFGELLVKRLTEVPAAPSVSYRGKETVPRELDALIMQCLERDSAKRPQQIVEVEARLRTIAAAQACELETFVAAPAPPLTPRRWQLAAAAAAALLLVGLTVGILATRKPAPPALPTVTIAPAATPAPTAARAPEPPATGTAPVAPPSIPSVQATALPEPGAHATAKLPATRPTTTKEASHSRRVLDGPSRRAVLDPFR